MQKILWRIKLIIAKILGRIKRFGWLHIIKVLFDQPIVKPVSFRLIKEDSNVGIGLYKSEFFPELWIPLQNDPGCDIDQCLFTHNLYHATYIGDLVSKGDTVIDGGGYIGLFTLWCIKKGANRVIVFEPDKRNCECIRRNLSSFIDSEKVILIEKGLWNSYGVMNLNLNDDGVSHSLISGEKSVGLASVAVIDIDTELQRIKHQNIDFIKMDIEGAEREALIGAKEVISKDKPKMFICSYHLPDDPQVIKDIVLRILPDYMVSYTGYPVNKKGIGQEQGIVFTWDR